MTSRAVPQSLRPHWCRNPITIFCSNCLLILTFPSVLRAFPEGPQSESTEHNPGTSKHRGQGGSSPWIFDLAARIRSRISPETGTNFVTNSIPKSSQYVSVLFLCAQRSTPNPCHLLGQNPCQLWKHFPSDFSGCWTLVSATAFGCRYFSADQQRLVS